MAQVMVTLHGKTEPLGERTTGQVAYRATEDTIRFLEERGHRVTDHTVGDIKMKCSSHPDRSDPCVRITVNR